MSLILEELRPVIRRAKSLAIQYRALTGRPLGITGEIAEYEAAKLLGLELADVRQSGYDAIRPSAYLRRKAYTFGALTKTNRHSERSEESGDFHYVPDASLRSA